MRKSTMSAKKAALWTTVTMVGVVGLIGFVAHFFMGDDAFIEEAAETYIEQTTGLSIDLTPGSPEKHT